VVEESTMPTVGIDAGNDTPGPNRPTSIGVFGSDFPPGTAVNIKVDAGKVLRGTANVRADGSFDWSATVRPKLACNSSVSVVVHGSDGVEVSAQTDVFCP
jgi:hypothetical protein